MAAPDDAATRLGLSDHAPLIVDFGVGSIGTTNLIDEPESDPSGQKESSG
jgi:hypothetical protein